jgi:hypothetical protein
VRAYRGFGQNADFGHFGHLFRVALPQFRRIFLRENAAPGRPRLARGFCLRKERKALPEPETLLSFLDRGASGWPARLSFRLTSAFDIEIQLFLTVSTRLNIGFN